MYILRFKFDIEYTTYLYKYSRNVTADSMKQTVNPVSCQIYKVCAIQFKM